MQTASLRRILIMGRGTTFYFDLPQDQAENFS